MLRPEFKEILAPPKHSVLYEASQSIVCFAGVNKAQCQKMDILGLARFWLVEVKSYPTTIIGLFRQSFTFHKRDQTEYLLSVFFVQSLAQCRNQRGKTPRSVGSIRLNISAFLQVILELLYFFFCALSFVSQKMRTNTEIHGNSFMRRFFGPICSQAVPNRSQNHRMTSALCC